MKFREHRSTLAESMATDRAALVALLAEQLQPFSFVVTDDLVSILPGPGDWHIVTIAGYGVAGFVEVDGFGCEPHNMRKLRAIVDRLFDDKPLTADQRRNLANEMHVILGQIAAVPL